MLLLSIFLTGLCAPLALVLAQEDAATSTEAQPVSWTSANAAGLINEILQDKMLDNAKADDVPFQGLGCDDEALPFPNSEVRTFPNLVAVGALTARASLSKSAKAQTMAMMDSWNEIKSYTSDPTRAYGFLLDNSDRDLPDPLMYSWLQGAALDYLSIAYRYTQNGEISVILSSLYNGILKYQSNGTVGYQGDMRAFWTAIHESLYQGMGQKYDAHPIPYKGVLANASLWVAAGVSNAYRVLLGTGSEISDQVLPAAEGAMSFVDTDCFNVELGLYKEHPEDSSGRYYLETQALAMLTCARLHYATKKASYINRANLILQKINQYFWVSGVGGAVRFYDTVSGRAPYLMGWDNALLAYACAELYETTGQQSYIDVAKVIMNFMWNRLRYNTAAESVNGFVEFTPATQARPVEPYDPTSLGQGDHRYTTTNALAVYVNEQIAYSNLSWIEKNMVVFLLIILVIVVAIVVVILVRRRAAKGTKLPKVVKGLIGD